MWNVEAIGETAGQVWLLLNSHEKFSLSSVKRQIHAPSSLVDMAVGWLAREGKIELIQEKRAVRVWLK